MTLFEQQFKKYKPALTQGIRLDVLQSFFPSPAHFCYFITQLKARYSVSFNENYIKIYGRKKTSTLHAQPARAKKAPGTKAQKLNIFAEETGIKNYDSIRIAAAALNVKPTTLHKALTEKRCFMANNILFFPFRENENYTGADLAAKIETGRQNRNRDRCTIAIYAVNMQGEKIASFAAGRACAATLNLSVSSIWKYLKNKTPITYNGQTVILTH